MNELRGTWGSGVMLSMNKRSTDLFYQNNTFQILPTHEPHVTAKTPVYFTVFLLFGACMYVFRTSCSVIFPLETPTCRPSSRLHGAPCGRRPNIRWNLSHPVDFGEMVMAEGTVVLRRNRPGTKAKDFYNWPDESFEEMDSTLAVQQYIQQNIRSDCANIDKILEPPEGQDEGVWKYEHLRQFCLELNGLAVKLQGECHPETCTQMTATEQWIFLCAAHKTPKECPAIDYTRHTLDGAACLLNSNKYFPSRVSIKESSVAKLGSVCRRIYRIFSHAYFHHRQIFDKYENETFLCHRFTRFVVKYNLMSKDNLIVPILEEEVQNSSTGESEA
uniref:MOB-like protein phocein n=2 Tax=Denticeps clupeoides TaxID=299321 RepID=A0AAY4AZ38_9TELE